MDFQVDTAYLHNLAGEKVGHVEVVQDITDKVRIQNYQKKEAENLRLILDKVAQGDLTVSYEPEPGDEYTGEAFQVFSNIAQSLQHMVENLKIIIGNLRESTDIVASNAEESSAIADSMATALEEMSASFNEVAQMGNETLKVVDEAKRSVQFIQKHHGRAGRSQPRGQRHWRNHHRYCRTDQPAVPERDNRSRPGR